MPSRDEEIRIVATDDASKVIDKVADKLTDLDKQGDASIEITADDKASADIRSVSQRLAGLSGEDTRIVLTAQVSDAERDITRILKSLSRVDEMDDEEVQIRVEALGNARQRLDQVQAELRDLDGETADIKVEATGLDDITDKLGSLPGALGDIGGALGGLGAAGGAAAGVGALVTGMYAAATAAKDLALEAKTTADLTGSTVEEASKLQSLWGRTGADINDLNDVLLQMNGALAQSPELAAQLGINLDDGKNITQRFVEMTDKLAAGQLNAQQASACFGEEGVRQVGKLRTVFGGLSDDLEGMPAPIDEEAVAQALEMERAMGELKSTMSTIATTVGQDLMGVFTEAAEAANNLVAALPGADNDALKGLAEGYRQWATGLGILEKGLGGLNNLIGDNNEEATKSVDLWGAFGRTLEGAADAVADAADGQGSYADAVADTRTQLEGQVDAIYAAMAAEEEQATARRAAADAGIAFRESQRQFAEQLAEFPDLLADEESSLEDVARAMDQAATAAAEVADNQLRMAEDTARAEGKVVSAASKQRIWNDSMLTSAATAQGPLRSSILAYVAEVNKIPPEKVTAIEAAIAAGDLELAKRLLDEATAPRDAEMVAEPTNLGPTNNALNNVANPGGRPRSAYMQAVMLGGVGGAAGGAVVGGTAAPAGRMAVGEDGEAMVTAAPMAAAAGPSVGAVTPLVVRVAQDRLPTPSITINAGVVGNRFDVERVVANSLRRYERRNGRRRP